MEKKAGHYSCCECVAAGCSDMAIVMSSPYVREILNIPVIPYAVGLRSTPVWFCAPPAVGETVKTLRFFPTKLVLEDALNNTRRDTRSLGILSYLLIPYSCLPYAEHLRST